MGVVEQIATEAGVSTNTVLRVLRRENKEVWPSAARRASEIRSIAQRLGYLPSGSARAMRRGRCNAVSLLLSTDKGRSYLPDDLFNGIHDALHDLAMYLIVSKLGDEALTSEQFMPVILREWSCDGLLINYTDRVPPQMDEMLAKYRIPSIWINRKLLHDAVYYDELAGARTATEHLLQLGHRRIAYLDFIATDTWENTHYSRADRYAGYAQAMQAAGLTPTSREQFAGVPVEDRLAATSALLCRPDRPTAIVSYDAGLRVIFAAQRAGLSVPRDLSVLSFAAPAGRKHGEEFMGFNVSQMTIPATRAGHRAVQALLTNIQTKRRQASTVLPLELFAGDTCGPAPTQP